MKALILAAGKSQRLSSLRLGLPKPLIPINGKPLLEHHITNCAASGIKDIFINLHHMHDQIKNHFGDGSRFGVRIHYNVESELLGTSGAVKAFESELKSEPFLVIYGDNFWEYSISEILAAHQKAQPDMSIVLFQKDVVSQSGVAELDQNGMITRFIEKPAIGASFSKWVNAGIYVISPNLLSFIPGGFSDFGKDIIPNILTAGKKVFGIQVQTPVIAVDTPELLAKTKQPLLILDRDGTINEMVANPDHGIIDSPLHPNQVEVLDETIHALKSLQEMGCVFAIATNQPAAAKGKTTQKNLELVHERILDILKDHQVNILSSHICFHRSEDLCSCRKPKTKLLLDAFHTNPGHLRQNTWMVGDGVTDVQAGASLGLKTAFIGSRKNEIAQQFEKLAIQPTFWGSKLTEFADWFKNNGC